VNVDIATYKAEFLSHYWEGRLRPRHAYAFGFIDRWARLASVWPGLVNLVTQTPGLSHLAKVAAGMPLQRRIPEFAPESFQQWFSRRQPRQRDETAGRVVLWADTFNNYFFPETAQAATEVLENLGYQVEVPRQHLCCGRPLYDYGFLDQAKTYLHRVLQALEPQINAGVPLIVLEPSCASVFRDELRNLFPNDLLARRLREQTLLLSEFLDKNADSRLPRIERKALVQGHCHHKSVLKFEAESSVLGKLGLDCEVLASGCCGMAGSFGFEKDKYDVSIAIGERKLLPAIRQAPSSTMVLADGFSCREQIAQETGRQALHLAEVMQIAMQGRDDISADVAAEHALTQRRKASRRKARMRALAVLGTLAAGGALAYRLLRKH
jgi:Fe-S oxidoreductase